MTMNKDFLNVCVEVPSGCYDVVYLRVSYLRKNLQIKGLPHKNHFKIGSEDVQSYLLRDSTYLLQVNFMKYFSSKAIGTPQQNLFSRKWRERRMKIENSFGFF